MKKLNMKNYWLISSLFLVGCATKPIPVVNELNIYQPSILVIEEGTEIQTKNGKYKAQTEEVWHSDKRFRELERKAY